MITTLVDYSSVDRPLVLWGKSNPSSQEAIEAVDGSLYLENGNVWKKTNSVWELLSGHKNVNGLIVKEQFDAGINNLVIESAYIPELNKTKTIAPVKNPTYLLTNANASNITDEGTNIRINVITTSVQNGTTLTYFVSGLNITEGDTIIEGTVTIYSNRGVIEQTINRDHLAEGTENLIVSLSTGESIDFVILDTSTAFTYDVAATGTPPNKFTYSTAYVSVTDAQPDMYVRVLDAVSTLGGAYTDSLGDAVVMFDTSYQDVPKEFTVDFGYGQLQKPIVITPV